MLRKREHVKNGDLCPPKHGSLGGVAVGDRCLVYFAHWRSEAPPLTIFYEHPVASGKNESIFSGLKSRCWSQGVQCNATLLDFILKQSTGNFGGPLSFHSFRRSHIVLGAVLPACSIPFLHLMQTLDIGSLPIGRSERKPNATVHPERESY
jgi:hypothetical protein